MSFIVEDGTGLVAGANSYTSVAEFKAYFDSRGFDYSSYNDTRIQQALVQGTDYIELRFHTRFKGCRLIQDPEQPLSFPRFNLFVRYLEVLGIPANLKNATSEYAKQVLVTGLPLAPTPAGYDSTGQIIQQSTQKVGPIEVSATYEAGSGGTVRLYPAADGLLVDYVYPSDGVVRN